jgi:biopolymer transport protein ExbD/biopolymer transport protein TolR
MELNADINVVNLIDVMLLLLVVFMITAPMMTGGVDIRLPRAEARPMESKSGLTVTIAKAGTVTVDETAMNFEDFRVAFKSMARQRGKQGLYLRVDQSVEYGFVARVLAVMKSANVGEVGLVMEPETIPR